MKTIKQILKNPVKFIINKFGLCEKCFHAITYDYLHKKFICPNCKVNEAVKKFKEKYQIKEDK